jgi:hypothetical protein
MNTRMRWPWYAAAAIAISLGIFALGRFSAPVRTETKNVYVDREVVKWRDVEKKVEGPVRVVVKTRLVPGPQGPVVERERVVERGAVTTERASDGQASRSTQIETKTVSEYDRAHWLLGASVGMQIGKPGEVYGGQILYRVIGPAWLGIAGDSSGAAKLQFAISF